MWTPLSPVLHSWVDGKKWFLSYMQSGLAFFINSFLTIYNEKRVVYFYAFCFNELHQFLLINVYYWLLLTIRIPSFLAFLSCLPIMLSCCEILFPSDVTGDDIWPDIELVLLFKKEELAKCVKDRWKLIVW